MSHAHAFFIPVRLRNALLACACATGALAAQAQSAMPAWQGAGSVRYVCGGIGSDESTAMRAAMKDHPLALLFSRADGAYMANVGVAIKGGDANTAAALALTANGPVCLIDLPAGRYTIDVTAPGGETKSQTVTVGGGSKTASFRF
ncbi:carboxypeptidase regulatory-like domain-containing protein [Variovorax sp. PAMC26660]|uniref:carboxypeptidase regulatory-like domain-containing protein n=1 Tax=Variovorax sp. PAMC26660 TaxID=2762322 RepID=UPI00164E3FD3|nr:carboxypeptidase regulatory-like domain-containing protein [Variovorax sp. PAMC26660]QNK70572.1 carboxypeptidase regulatory-like domain-containing protein [Variovorax sp. PAMC26660]